MASGTVDGDGHTITGLTVERPQSGPTGLFAETSGTVRNVTLAEASIVGGYSTGGIAGENTGTVTTSAVSGNLSAVAIEGDAEGGGLVGFNAGTVSASYATGAVSADDAGGLVGRNSKTIERSFAAGNVTANSGGQSGGLTGAVGDRGAVTDSYWDRQASGQGSSAGNGTGLTTGEMYGVAAQSNMIGFDFSARWAVQGNDYPTFVWGDVRRPASETPTVERTIEYGGTIEVVFSTGVVANGTATDGSRRTRHRSQWLTRTPTPTNGSSSWPAAASTHRTRRTGLP